MLRLMDKTDIFVMHFIKNNDVMAFSIDNMNLKYIIDETGEKTEVVIPIEVWTEIRAILELDVLKQKLKKAFQDVEAIEKGELPEVTLSEFLKNDLTEAFQEMHDMKNGLKPRLSFNDVIDEL
ncbi:hypothetical protein [Haliscomenobacter hydrossis]|uniref:Uncharacterized protein n=1 Tax=Haliscomenobacter hydrossis (strain ATCC 27775 / DSM 1100 / LMG 10767 / O) TaxID=760192 RepID=F4KX50_HALH1|nr:hypothetical protein [Haliscomenobacter hydrossis]AEE48278.1 hypothetical protein Halhy_0366 [Haliscomenobacter hydrossis DSM 1100]